MVNGYDDFEFFYDFSFWVEEIFIIFLENKKFWIESLFSFRILKSYLLFEVLLCYLEWKYIYLVRDGRDVGLFLYYYY